MLKINLAQLLYTGYSLLDCCLFFIYGHWLVLFSRLFVKEFSDQRNAKFIRFDIWR